MQLAVNSGQAMRIAAQGITTSNKTPGKTLLQNNE